MYLRLSLHAWSPAEQYTEQIEYCAKYSCSKKEKKKK